MSDSLLLDTDVASYLFKNSPRAKPFRPLLKGKRPALAFVSVAELFKWTLKRGWGPEKINLNPSHRSIATSYSARNGTFGIETYSTGPRVAPLACRLSRRALLSPRGG